MIRDITIGQYYPVESVVHPAGSAYQAVWNADLHYFIIFRGQPALLCSGNRISGDGGPHLTRTI